MSLATIDNILLRILVDSNLSAKGNPLTWDEEDLNFKIIRDALAELASAGTSGFDSYNAGTTYSNTNPDYVVYNSNIYEFINPVPASGVTPGTDPLTWQIVSQGEFSHIKNRDTFLDEGGSFEVTAEDIRNLLDSYTTDIADVYTAIDAKVSDTAYNATSWNGVTTIAPSKNAVRDEIEAIYAAIAGVDLTALWNKSGNTLASRGTFGSTSGAFGWDFKRNNTVLGGLGDSTGWYWGGSSAFASTDHSFYGSGNTSASYIWQAQNSDNSQRAWLRGDGLFSSSNGYAQGSNVLLQEASSVVKIGSITDAKKIEMWQGGIKIFESGFADFMTFDGYGGTKFNRQGVESFRITQDGSSNVVVVMASKFYNNGDGYNVADLFNRKLYRNNGDVALDFTDMQKHSVSPTSPNRTVQISINGETIYLHGKTTND
jgi:hypothetical protein